MNAVAFSVGNPVSGLSSQVAQLFKSSSHSPLIVMNSLTIEEIKKVQHDNLTLVCFLVQMKSKLCLSLFARNLITINC